MTIEFIPGELAAGAQAARQSLIEEEEARKQREIAEAAAKQKAEQEAAIAKDSHAAKPANEFGAKENMKEISNALAGGVRDTASSILTAPERAVDMANGQMVDQGPEYNPEWNPLGGDKDPITKTWWGNLLRGGVHFGTMGLAVVGASRIPGIKGVVGKAAGTAVGKAVASKWIGRGAVIGAASDLVSEYSQEDNISGQIAKRYPQFDTPLATKDSDHPIMKTLKNVVEGGGIGKIFDGVAAGFGRIRDAMGTRSNPTREALNAVDGRFARNQAAAEAAAKAQLDKNLRATTEQKLLESGIDFNKLSPEEQIAEMTKVAKKYKGFKAWSPPDETNVARAERKIEERGRSVDDQTLEQAEIELEDPNFRGHKNKPIADIHQGNPLSTGSVYDVTKQVQRIHKEWGSELGSTDNLVTTAAAKRMAEVDGLLPEAHESIARELLGDIRYQNLINELKAQKKNTGEVFRDALERMHEVMTARGDTSSMTPDEFWEPVIRNLAQTGGDDNLAYWATREVVAADLINASMFKQARDLAIAAREIYEHLDVMDVDAPMTAIRDRLIVGISNVKRSRYLVSEQFRNLQNNAKPRSAAEQAARLAEIHGETKEAVDHLMELAQKAPTDDLLQATLEAFSMSNKISNWDDLFNWMQARLRGYVTDDGVTHTGAMIKELQGVMVHSILSGPKTPVRAVMGTSTATFTRPLAQTLGGVYQLLRKGDPTTLRSGLAQTNAMVQAIPESWKLFQTKLNGYWTGDISTVKTRMSEYSLSDEHWKLMEEMMNGPKASLGDRAAFAAANVARTLNHNKFLTYSTKLMAATDDAFGYIMGRARAKDLALREALEAHKVGDITVVNKDVIQAFEDRFMKQIFDADGNVTDAALEFAKKEVTLTTDLSGFAQGLETLMNNAPWTKPFFLFARTGINGMNLTAEHLPLLNLALREQRDIMFANPNNLAPLAKYGINTVADLDNAKALSLGRQAIGTAVVFAASQKFMAGEITGNGPQNRQLRAQWEKTGWKPRHIKLGDVWVSYDAFEPFNNILAFIADLGTAQKEMGPEWVEKGFARTAFAIAQSATSKSYLSGLNSLMDLFSNDPKSLDRIAAGLANNTIPLGGLRNEIGKIITPYMRELNSGLADSLRNRNLYLEPIAGEALPIQYDILNGKPLKDWDFPTRMFNAVSPVQISLMDGPGRQMLWNSNYDLVTSVTSSPTGVSLAKDAKVRSLYQRAIGRLNIEKSLDELAARPDVQASIKQMYADLDAGRRFLDPMKAYKHNDLIKAVFETARKKAWAQIQDEPEVKRLVAMKRANDLSVINTRAGNFNAAQQQAQQFLQLQNK